MVGSGRSTSSSSDLSVLIFKLINWNRESNLGAGPPIAQLASLSIWLLPGALRVNQAHRLAGQQPDNLCGPYWVTILLQAYDRAAFSAEAVALLAKSVLPVGDSSLWLPKGASSRQNYSIALPQSRRVEVLVPRFLD
jgi:hypothetical protein